MSGDTNDGIPNSDMFVQSPEQPQMDTSVEGALETTDEPGPNLESSNVCERSQIFNFTKL